MLIRDWEYFRKRVEESAGCEVEEVHWELLKLLLSCACVKPPLTEGDLDYAMNQLKNIMDVTKGY